MSDLVFSLDPGSVRSGFCVMDKNQQIKQAGLYREYQPEDDKGGDIADAIGLALWFLKEQSVLEVYKMSEN